MSHIMQGFHVDAFGLVTHRDKSRKLQSICSSLGKGHFKERGSIIVLPIRFAALNSNLPSPAISVRLLRSHPLPKDRDS